MQRGRYVPQDVERKIEEWWKENDIPRKVFEVNKHAPIFSFLEGPPTANGFMHVGHARGRVYKDIVLRFYTMKGMNVWRRAGWDCLGLPTELEVEKKLGFTSKKDIEIFGLDRFVEEANKLVDFYIDHWRKASEKLALWLDYDNAYETRKEEYMEHVWELLRKAYDDGMLIESFKVVACCPSCETPLSSHEVAQGYEEVEDPSLYVKFKIKDRENEFIVIWTTTPWTLPGNEAIAVNPKMNYVRCMVGNEIWIVGEEALKRVVDEVGIKEYKVVQRFKGSKLLGLEYEHPFIELVSEHKKHGRPAHTVVLADFVKMEEGTGCVHIAPAHGPEDFELGKSIGLPIFCPVNMNGYFSEGAGAYSGLYFKVASERIVEDLKRMNLLVKHGRILHNYPFCWRCGTPLIYLASRQWFLKIDRIKEKMLEENKKVNWKPEWAGTNRFGDWIANAEDWCISRTKVWGTPLPIWICTRCGNKLLIDRKSKLNDAIKKPEKFSMFRPWIDEFVFRCSKCGGEMRRDQFVLDTWLDSGVAHFASVNYLGNKELFTKLFPYDFITEAIDQTRGWFYTLLFTSVLYFGRAPFKSVLNQGHVLDSEGKKMSKSKGNVIWAMDAFERFGVDPLRLYLVSKAQPWETINFIPSEVEDITEELNILWNVFSFVKTYYELDKYVPSKHNLIPLLRYATSTDKWILSRINSLTATVTRSIENLEIYTAARSIRNFIVEDLSHIYLRSIRRRVWIEEMTWEKIMTYTILYYVLRRLLTLMAPFTPYIAEYLYLQIRSPEDPESIHLLKWPKVDENFIDPELEDGMAVTQTVLSTILAARQKAGRKLRWPIKAVMVIPKTDRVKKLLAIFQDYLKLQSNAEDLIIMDVGSRPGWLKRTAVPVLSSLGRKFGHRLNLVLEAIRSIPAEEIERKLIEEGKATITLKDGERVELGPDDVSFKDETPQNILMEEGKLADIYLDLTETDTIRSISLVNEVIRRIQVTRKEAGLSIGEVAECIVSSDSKELIEATKKMMEYVEEETRTKIRIMDWLTNLPDKYYVKDWKIGESRLLIAISRE